MDTEILVHIKASSRVADDKRYVAIAQGVIDFEPVHMTRVTHFSTHDSLSEQESSVQNTVPSSISLDIEGNTKTFQEFASDSVLSGKVRNSYRISKLSLSSRLSYVQKKVRNPPYKSPLRKQSVESLCVGHTHENPCTTIPIGSEEHCTRILVPNTEKQTRKRNWSEAFHAQSEFIVVSDSQQIIPADPSSPSRSGWAGSPTLLTDTAQEQKHSCCKIGSSMEDAFHLPSETAVHTVTRKRSDLEQQLHPPPPSTMSYGIDRAIPNKGASCSADKDSHWERRMHTLTGSPKDDRTATDEVTSTVTVSQQSQILRDHLARDPDLRQSVIPPSPIDLTTPQSSGTNMRWEDSSSHPEPHTQPDPAKGFYSLVGIHQPLSSFAGIQQLPLVISDPNLDVKHFYKPAYQQPIMRATAEALTLPRHFQPETMTRKVMGKERGYWKIPIRVVTSIRADRERSMAPGHTQNMASSDWKPLLKHNSLTESEFLTIWEDLNGFISSGNTGWSVKVVRRNFSITRSRDPDGTELDFYLQVFCYGEDIPHVYAMLLVCTRMYALCQPVKWVSTVDERPVITMTGDELRRGCLGPWTCHSDDQGKKFWECSVRMK